MKVGIVTQARMMSTRLPRKVLMKAGGRTFLDHHIDRLACADFEIVVATTTNATDDPIVDIAERRGLSHYRGSENDVLARFAGATRAFDLDVVVRVTSDCPLIDGRLVRHGIDLWREVGDPWLYLSNTLSRTFPRGLDFEVFSADALLDADEHATSPACREHVTPYLYRNGSGRATLKGLSRPGDAGRFRITLDTAEDRDALTALIEKHGAAEMDSEALIKLLETRPEVVAINAQVEQKKFGD